MDTSTKKGAIMDLHIQAGRFKITALLLGCIIIALTSGTARAKLADCAQRVYDPPDTLVVNPLTATAAGSSFRLTYMFLSGRIDWARFVAIDVDHTSLTQVSISPQLNATQEISLFSLTPGRHRIYVEFMNKPSLRGRSLMAIETCIDLPVHQTIDKWQLIP